MASARSAYCRACAPSSASRAAIWENRSVWGERLSITGWPQKATLLPFRKASRASSPCAARSEEHTSELQSRLHLVCRLLLEKKNARLGVPGKPVPPEMFRVVLDHPLEFL